MSDLGHVPVLLDEVLRLLAPRAGETFIDATLGRGGHAEAIARAVGPEGRLIGADLDPANLEFVRDRLKPLKVPLELLHTNFAALPAFVRELGGPADGLLADLGFSSNQMDDPERGFSFATDGPLDMRLDPTAPRTAADLVAELDERALADVIYSCGEEPFSRKIARKLVESRKSEPIETTARLAGLVREAYGARARQSRMHPATRTFMALRIAVNDELGGLTRLLELITEAAASEAGDAWLRRGARVGIISFHSLEDRLVKRAFVELDRRGLATRLTRKPVTAGEQEVAGNVRARSAKLRVVRIDGPNSGSSGSTAPTRDGPQRILRPGRHELTPDGW